LWLLINTSFGQSLNCKINFHLKVQNQYERAEEKQEEDKEGPTKT